LTHTQRWAQKQCTYIYIYMGWVFDTHTEMGTVAMHVYIWVGCLTHTEMGTEAMHVYIWFISRRWNIVKACGAARNTGSSCICHAPPSTGASVMSRYPQSLGAQLRSCRSPQLQKPNITKATTSATVTQLPHSGHTAATQLPHSHTQLPHTVCHTVCHPPPSRMRNHTDPRMRTRH
jgi:hypothetical protein